MGKFYSSLVLAAAISLVLAAAIISNVAAAELNWQTNLQSAKAQAKKENKTLLLDFTGTDWCPACIKLKKSVFNKPEFAKYADEKLVLVEVDFPLHKKQSVELKEQNDELSKKFKVEAFPTILLLDADGKELGRLEGYEGDSPADYVKLLEKIVAKQSNTK